MQGTTYFVLFYFLPIRTRVCLLVSILYSYHSLQGELKACGKYTIHYKNVFHAFYVIGRSDGILALQSGLVPALWYQLFMNGIRLGAYQCFINMGLTKDSKGNSSIPRSIFAGAVSGTMWCLGWQPYLYGEF